MGCCQSSTVSNSDQVDLDPSKQEAPTIPTSFIPEIHNLNFENLKTSYKTSPDFACYTLGAELSSYSCISRYSCVSKKSGQQKEAILIQKLSLLSKDCEKLLENSKKVSAFSNEHVAKILHVTEDKDYVKIVTEPCGTNSLENIIKNNKLTFTTALVIMKQIMQGVLQYHKLGVVLKHLSEQDVFLVNNVVKISISAAIYKLNELDAPDSEVSLKNDVWNSGVIFLKLLLSSTEVRTVQEGLDLLEDLSLHDEDKENIKAFFKPLHQRPALPQVMQFKWKDDAVKSSKGYAIEKISEEISDVSAEDNQSARIEKSEGSSNEFYQSEDFDFNNDEWQEIDVDHGKIRICEILNNEMKEITESIPEHEVSSLDNQSLVKSLPETPLVTNSQDNNTILVIPEIGAGLEELSDFDTNLCLSQKALAENGENSNFANLKGVAGLSDTNILQLTGYIKLFDYKKKLGIVVCNENSEEFVLTLDEIVSSKLNVGQILKELVNGSKVQIKFSLMPDSRKLLDISYLL